LLVGEMRDLPTIAAAVSAAETGHLVFGTLHTVSVDTSVDRLINVFPAIQQDQVRAMLAESLRAVACQYLLPRRDTPGRVLALEIMLCNDAVSNLIRKGKTFQIPSVLASSVELGMRTMDSELMGLFKAGRISAEDAYIRPAPRATSRPSSPRRTRRRRCPPWRRCWARGSRTPRPRRKRRPGRRLRRHPPLSPR